MAEAATLTIALGLVAWAAQGLESIRESVVEQPAVEPVSARVPAAEQLNPVLRPAPVHVVYLQAVSRSAACARPAAVIEYSSAGPAMPVAPGFAALFAPVLAVSLAPPPGGRVLGRPKPPRPPPLPAGTAPRHAPLPAGPCAAAHPP